MRFLLAAVSAALALTAAEPDTRLVEAARTQDRAALLGLLKQHLNVNATDPAGETALYWAAHWGDAESVDALLRAGAKVNIASRYGLTPLWEAANRADAAVAGKLVKAGADVNAANPQGETALFPAARTGSVEIAGLLVGRGSDVNRKESWRGETPLMLAAAEGQTEVVRLLLTHGANPDVRSAAFDLQDRDGIVGLQSSLYWKGGLTALLFAARQGHIEAGRALVDAGADTSLADADFGFTPLMTAIFNGHLDFARMLVGDGKGTRGVNVNDGSLYVLIDQRNMIPQRGDEQTVAGLTRLLLDRGADPNVPFNNGKVPPRVTYPAIRYGPIAAGSTPLLSAARTQDVATMRMLLDKHADPNRATTVDRLTPMMAASTVGGGGRAGRGGRGAAGNPVAAVQLLIERGADVNAVNSRGMTAMHYAARAGNRQAIQLLADHGAKLDVKDRLGRTPLDMANGVMTAVTGADGPANAPAVGLIEKLSGR